MSAATLPPLSSLPQSYVHEYSGDRLRNVAIAFIVLECVFIFLRFLSKRVGRNPLGADDWLMVASLIVCVGLNASAFVAVNLTGVGWHAVVIEETHPEKMKEWAKVLVAVPIIYAAACSLPRLAVLVFYKRVFTFGPARYATFVLGGIIIATAIADILAAALECRPLAYLWDKTIPNGTCDNIPAFFRYATLPNAVTDLCMLLLPIPTVWTLHSSRKVKIGLTFTFLTGSVGLITSILRTVAFFKHNPVVDGTYVTVTYMMWGLIEPGCYFIAACLICLRPLLSYISGRRPDDGPKEKGSSHRFTSWQSFLRSAKISSGSSGRFGSRSFRRDSAEAIDTSSHVNIALVEEDALKLHPLPRARIEPRFRRYDDEDSLVHV